MFIWYLVLMSFEQTGALYKYIGKHSVTILEIK